MGNDRGKFSGGVFNLIWFKREVRKFFGRDNWVND